VSADRGPRVEVFARLGVYEHVHTLHLSTTYICVFLRRVVSMVEVALSLRVAAVLVFSALVCAGAAGRLVCVYLYTR